MLPTGRFDHVAAANGKVIERKYEPMGFGNYIVIRHAYGFATKYAHLDNVYVEEGDVVTQGQKIGTMGNTGMSTGPHLHFEVRIGAQVVDPERFLNVQADLR
ncbi:MAG: M23 family metallopeptidase [Spirochaetia bacterium]|nr:M23 family metallopeptidase [Spirochaetia bacterium]